MIWLGRAVSGRVGLPRSCHLIRFALVAAEREKFTDGELRRPVSRSIIAESVNIGGLFSHSAIDAGHSSQRLNQLVHMNPVSSRPPRADVLAGDSS